MRSFENTSRTVCHPPGGLFNRRDTISSGNLHCSACLVAHEAFQFTQSLAGVGLGKRHRVLAAAGVLHRQRVLKSICALRAAR